MSAEIDVPLHVQVRRDIKDAVERGALPPGTQLPGVSSMASAFGVNRLTVLKATNFLIVRGVLTSVRGRGIYASARAKGQSADDDEDIGVSFFEGIAEGAADQDGDEPGLDNALGKFVTDAILRDTISFAAGFPPEDLIPADSIRRLTNRLMQGRDGRRALGYALPPGHPALIEQITALLRHRGLNLGENDRIIVTSGAQQALCLFLERFIRDKGALAMESPGYMGAIAACRMRQIPMVPVPVDAGGINPARMAQALAKEGVAGVYTVPSYQNPTGVSQLARRREKVLALANQYGATVFEDDIYADLRLGGRSIRPIKSLPGGERVVYAGSFSKSLAPGLRVGFMVASGKLARDLLHFKESHDICTGRLTQAVVAAFIERGGYRRHLMRVRREYKRRRDAMLEALHTHLDVPHRVTHPKGGMHLWVMFESPLDMAGLEEMAEKRGVSFAPGTLFFTDGRRASSLRLNFSANPVETIHEGIVRLAQCIKKEIMR